MENMNKVKNATFEIKHTLDKFNSILDTVETKISELEETQQKLPPNGTQTEKKEWKKWNRAISEL